MNEQEKSNNQIPDHLTEGYETFLAWQHARQLSGKPLPPGGVFLINNNSVLLEEVSLFAAELMRQLDMPKQNVKIDFEERKNIAGQPAYYPAVHCTPPKKWFGKTKFKQSFNDGKSAREMGAIYVQATIDSVWKQCVRRYKHRTQGIDAYRTDLVPKVIIDVFNTAQKTKEEKEHKEKE